MIIVEGPDGAGKTTLCKWICKKYKLTMGSRSTKDRDKIYKTTRRDSWSALCLELLCLDRPLVWDRIGPYSDPIYSAAGIPTKRGCSFTDSEIEIFDVVVQHVGLMIVCLPPLEVVVANVHKERQIEGLQTTPGLVNQIYDAYIPLADLYPTYDYTNPTNLSSMIENHLTRRKEREALAIGARQL